MRTLEHAIYFKIAQKYSQNDNNKNIFRLKTQKNIRRLQKIFDVPIKTCILFSISITRGFNIILTTVSSHTVMHSTFFLAFKAPSLMESLKHIISFQTEIQLKTPSKQVLFCNEENDNELQN